VEQAYDVLVVGGGPAGLSGALALARSRRSVVVVDDGRPRNRTADHVHNFLTADGVSPAGLLAAGRAEVERYGGEFIAGTATTATRDGDGFAVVVNDHTLRVRRLLVATGLTDELPDVPGLAARWGRDVLHCPHCHGWEFLDQRIGVLATEPTAGMRAAVWRQWSPHVFLLCHDVAAPAGAEAEWLVARGIQVIADAVAEVLTAADRLAAVRLASGEMLDLDALVVTPRYAARSDLLATLGIEPIAVELSGTIAGTQVPADGSGATSVPGLWVAGNVADLRGHAVIAAAAGLSAAMALNADLVAEDTRWAVAAHRKRLGGQDPRRAG
jgi:thioredoxin reductase